LKNRLKPMRLAGDRESGERKTGFPALAATPPADARTDAHPSAAAGGEAKLTDGLQAS
jgi:hypothetical protein